jgi:hypothetical protein
MSVIALRPCVSVWVYVCLAENSGGQLRALVRYSANEIKLKQSKVRLAMLGQGKRVTGNSSPRVPRGAPCVLPLGASLATRGVWVCGRRLPRLGRPPGVTRGGASLSARPVCGPVGGGEVQRRRAARAPGAAPSRSRPRGGGAFAESATAGGERVVPARRAGMRVRRIGLSLIPSLVPREAHSARLHLRVVVWWWCPSYATAGGGRVVEAWSLRGEPGCAFGGLDLV